MKRRAKPKDHATKALMKSGVYRLSEEGGEQNEKPKRGILGDFDDPYNYWSAVKYGSVLMFLLWWIPIFGPMIAGYVAGRRAGTPLKGVLAVSIPLAIVFLIATMVEVKIIPTVWWGFDLAPDAIFGALGSSVPVLSPFTTFTTEYLSSLINTIEGTSGIRLDFFILGIAFAYIGGAMALQTMREMQYVVQHGGDHGMHVHIGDPKSKRDKKGMWIFRRGGIETSEPETKEEQAPQPVHFNDMHDSSGAAHSFSRTAKTPARSRSMEAALEMEEDEEPLRKHRQKEFEKNHSKAKSRKLETSKKSDNDDYRFV